MAAARAVLAVRSAVTVGVIIGATLRACRISVDEPGATRDAQLNGQRECQHDSHPRVR